MNSLSSFPANAPTSLLLGFQRLRYHLAAQAASRKVSVHHALQPCVYIQLHCRRCGYLRQARAAFPRTDTVSCPGCRQPRPFSPMAIGFTIHPLPFYERIFLSGAAPHLLPWDKFRFSSNRSQHSPTPLAGRKPRSRSADRASRDYLHVSLRRYQQLAEDLLRRTAAPHSAESRHSAAEC
jgi:hypothetical protein